MTAPLNATFQSARGDKLVLRTLSLGDVEEFAVFLKANRPDFEKNGLTYLPQSQDAFSRWISEGIRCGVFSGDACVGLVAAEVFRGRLGVFYGVDKTYRRSGVATAAVRTLLQECLAAPDAPSQAVIHTLKTNRISMRLAQALGFARDEEADYRRQTGARSSQFFMAHTIDKDVFLLQQHQPGEKPCRAPRP